MKAEHCVGSCGRGLRVQHVRQNSARVAAASPIFVEYAQVDSHALIPKKDHAYMRANALVVAPISRLGLGSDAPLDVGLHSVFEHRSRCLLMLQVYSSSTHMLLPDRYLFTQFPAGGDREYDIITPSKVVCLTRAPTSADA